MLVGLNQLLSKFFTLLGGNTKGSASSEFRVTVLTLVVGVVLLTTKEINVATFLGMFGLSGSYTLSRGIAKTAADPLAVVASTVAAAVTTAPPTA